VLDLIRGGVIIFLLISFFGMGIWLWFYADRKQLDQLANMPLEDNDNLASPEEAVHE
jgi:cbb3-type cytochrome oxidase subunit 3